VAVDRPGIGGTSKAMDPGSEESEWAAGSLWYSYSRTVRRRLRTHSADTAAVVQSLQDGDSAAGLPAGPVKVVGVCAGTAFALHFVRHSNACHKALTLVTPWVTPECPHCWPMARLAASRWFFGRSLAGYVYGALHLSVAAPILRSLTPLQALEALEDKLTDAERTELERIQRSDARKSNDGENDWREALGSRALEQLGHNADAHNVSALRDDVRVCLSSLDELEMGNLEQLDVRRCVVFGGELDELVSPPAVRFAEKTARFYQLLVNV